jgi:hypothetical protein
MTIPKGSMVMMNVGSHVATTSNSYHWLIGSKQVWTLNHQRYSDSRDFNPMRQTGENTLTENNAINQDSEKRIHFTFGAGRRVCPGFHVAERNLFLAMSRILWGFTISPAKNPDGSSVPIHRDAVTPGLIVRPEDFE